MLRLLSIHQAALLLLYWLKKLPDPFALEAMHKVESDGNLHWDFMLFQWHLKNAIEADELPAIRKAKSRSEEKKTWDAVDVPEEIRERLPKQYTYWVAFSDLVAFAERPEHSSRNEYAHAREALARCAWMFAAKEGKVKDAEELFAHLEQLAENLSEAGPGPRLGETTLRGCAREILAAGEGLKTAKK